MFTLQKTLFIAGCFIFCFATLGMLYQEAIMVMLFTLFIPGPIIGFIISFFKKSTTIQRLIFFIATCTIYLLALYTIDIKTIDYKLAPIRILPVSILSAVLLQLLFDLTFKTKISYKDSFFYPVVIGLTASILPTISIFLFKMEQFSGWLPIALWISLFSIFPIWLYLFGKHLVKTGKIN